VDGASAGRFCFLRSAALESPADEASDAEVKRLVHLVAEKMTPGGIQPGFTLAIPLQHMLDRSMMNTHAIDSLELGPVTVEGGRAHAEVLWQDSHTTYQLVLVKEGNDWKIDLLGILPYAELGLRLERTLKNETEPQQLDRLVSLVPTP
jgi:hypothetical protein